MPYVVKPLPFKPNRLDGLTDRLLESHYENNYGGAVQRLNAIEKRLAALDWATAAGFDINGLKREALIAAGSMVLHEVYFDALGGPGGDPPDGALTAALERNLYGTVSPSSEQLAALTGYVIEAVSALERCGLDALRRGQPDFGSPPRGSSQ